MGTLRHGSPEFVYEVDDRALAHLAVVIIDKLRRGEAFSLSCPGAGGPTDLWVSRSVPMRFDFDDSAPISINRRWVFEMDRAARGPHGLAVTPEPVRSSAVAVRSLAGGVNA